MIARRAAGGSARRLVKFREVAADERVVLNWLARYAGVFVAELARVAAEGVVLARASSEPPGHRRPARDDLARRAPPH
jgi:hypothetical protein